MSLGQIANKVGLPRSTVQRIVSALQAEQLVVYQQNSRGFELGPEISALAAASQNNIVEQCRLFLIELTQATGETADLSVMRDGRMVFLDQVPGIHRLRTISSVGEVFPLTTTANGRACLASFPDQQALALVRSEWQTRGVEGDLEAFRQLLAQVRETGLAYDLDEHSVGISAIGISFIDKAGDVYAISVPVPSSRFDAVRCKIENALLKTAQQLAKP